MRQVSEGRGRPGPGRRAAQRRGAPRTAGRRDPGAVEFELDPGSYPTRRSSSLGSLKGTPHLLTRSSLLIRLAKSGDHVARHSTHRENPSPQHCSTYVEPAGSEQSAKPLRATSRLSVAAPRRSALPWTARASPRPARASSSPACRALGFQTNPHVSMITTGTARHAAKRSRAATLAALSGSKSASCISHLATSTTERARLHLVKPERPRGGEKGLARAPSFRHKPGVIALAEDEPLS